MTLIAVVGVAVDDPRRLHQADPDHYTITTRRLHIKRGIISREIQETRLERVQNVNYNQSVLQRMLQVGDVDFDTAAGDDYNFIFAGVANPDEVVGAGGPGATHAAQPTGLGDEPTAPSARPEPGRRRPSAVAPASARCPRPAAARSASTRSVRSQVKSWSSRPKWP